MSDPNFILLYVDNPAASAEFYSGLLGRQHEHFFGHLVVAACPFVAQ